MDINEFLESDPATVDLLRTKSEGSSRALLNTMLADWADNKGCEVSYNEAREQLVGALWPTEPAPATTSSSGSTAGGGCSACGRPLSAPESIARGTGPRCAGQ